MHVDARMAQILADCLTAADTPVVVSEAHGDFPIVYVNAAFETLTGYRAGDVLGRNCRLLQGPGTDPGTVRTIGDRLRAGQHTQVRLLNYRADGTPFWCELRISAVRDAAGDVIRFLAVQHDVTEEVALLRQATEAATHDPLTGLLNRTAFAAEVERELYRATRHHRAAGLLFLDVDRFKQVNDTHGHAVGDEYLLHVARALRRHLRAEDVCARHGGDEFTVLLTDLPAGDDAADVAATIAGDLYAALSEPFGLDHTKHRATVTIGSAVFPHHGSTYHELMNRADADMYRRKPTAPIADQHGAERHPAGGPEGSG